MFGCLRCYINRVFLYYFNITGQRYPFWFLKNIDGDIITFSLLRSPNVQKLYDSRGEHLKQAFVDKLFES